MLQECPLVGLPKGLPKLTVRAKQGDYAPWSRGGGPFSSSNCRRYFLISCDHWIADVLQLTKRSSKVKRGLGKATGYLHRLPTDPV